jgi:predicted enzyme related to lactoylglutathione lyase
MRTATVLLTLSLIGVSPSIAFAQALPADVGAGHIAWFDLATNDIAKSKAFYAQLFGWEFAPVEGTDQAAEIVAGGTHIGTIRAADGALSPFNGVVYVQVDDIQASTSKARELGATIAPGFPFDLPGGIGAIALLVDPGGHPIGMYARTPMAGE